MSHLVNNFCDGYIDTPTYVHVLQDCQQYNLKCGINYLLNQYMHMNCKHNHVNHIK